MASSYYYLSGKAKWAKLFKPDDKYKNWQINLYLDDESKGKFAESGMSMQPKRDDDGEFITFRRPEAKLIRNELVKFDPPTVTDANGQPLDKLVGNGSDVTIKVVVYDTIKGKGHRLEAVRVNNLVEYVKQDTPALAPGSAPAAVVVAAQATQAAKPAKKVIPF